MSKQQQKDPIAHLAAGAASGLASCVLLQPIDLVKTRLQQAASRGERRLILSTTKHIVQKDGLSGLWRGTVPTILRNVPGLALYFLVLSEIRSLFARSPTSLPASTQRQSTTISSLPVLTNSQNLVSGIAARATVGYLMMPITVVKVRYESNFYEYKTVAGALRSILRTEGLRGLWSGYGVTLVRDTPHSGLYLLFYEQAKLWIGAWGAPVLAPSLIHMSSAIFASVTATAVTQPFDLLKTRVQVKPAEYYNTLHAARKVLKAEGIRGFFDGLTLRLARKSFQSVIVWTLYEHVVIQSQKLRST